MVYSWNIRQLQLVTRKRVYTTLSARQFFSVRIILCNKTSFANTSTVEKGNLTNQLLMSPGNMFIRPLVLVFCPYDTE